MRLQQGVNGSGLRALVTGGAGFIGSHLLDRLVKEGAEVAVIDNLSSGSLDNIHHRIDFLEANVNSVEIERFVFDFRPNVVFHLAFNTNVPMSVNAPDVEMDSIAGSIRLFQALKDLRDHPIIIFASSEFIYGNAAVMPTPESETVDPIAPYAISKFAVENYLRFYSEAFGISGVVLRFGTVYGPRQKMGAMSDYIAKLSSDNQAEIYGDGSKTRDYIFVSDVVEACVRCLSLGGGRYFDIYNIGTGVQTSLNSIYRMIAEHLGKSANPIYLEDRPGEQIHCLLDCRKFSEKTNWRPRIPISEGLKMRIDDFLLSNR
ncbi:MAG: GDP-mannose 4,6-dehydratase [Deltaproteobacteria bacterium]|nr:GDP-mannose 4,6-dehydratase [Deltaproteobacteria bacterium]